MKCIERVNECFEDWLHCSFGTEQDVTTTKELIATLQQYLEASHDKLLYSNIESQVDNLFKQFPDIKDRK